MDYLRVFDHIVSIMHQDYAGKDEKKNWDKPDYYRKKINDLSKGHMLDDVSFYDLVFNYLCDFKDDHILFRHKLFSYQKIGFYVRRYQDALYVTKIINDQVEINLGMKIIKIDDRDLSYYEKKYPNYFKNRNHERQIWQFVLQRANQVTVDDLGVSKVLNIKKGIPISKNKEPYEIRLLDTSLVYMRFEDFNQPDIIFDLISKHREMIESCPYWIIDVRYNSGGSDNAYAPLLPYLFNQGEKMREDDVCFLMSDNNCKLRIKILEEFMAMGSQKPETKKMIDDYIDYIYKNWGKGFVKYSDDSIAAFDKTYDFPKKVIILTDVFCSSSGDQFVYDAKQSKKVYVMGRPTLGVIDYSNLAKIILEGQFELWYPTSKRAAVLRGELILGGVKPDRHIPWTPHHIDVDNDLLEAINEFAND